MNEQDYTRVRIVGDCGTREGMWAIWVDKDKRTCKLDNDPVVRDDLHYGDVVRVDRQGNFLEVVERGEYQTVLFWTPAEGEPGTVSERFKLARQLRAEHGCMCEPLTSAHLSLSIPMSADMEAILAATEEAGWVRQERGDDEPR